MPPLVAVEKHGRPLTSRDMSERRRDEALQTLTTMTTRLASGWATKADAAALAQKIFGELIDPITDQLKATQGRLREQQTASDKMTEDMNQLELQLEVSKAASGNARLREVTEIVRREVLQVELATMETKATDVKLCVGCLEPLSASGMALCSHGTHAMCGECFVPYCRAQLELDEAIVRDHNARLLCPNRLPQAGGCKGCFEEQTIAKMLPADVFGLYMVQVRGQIRAEEFGHANKQLGEWTVQLQKKLPGLERELLERQLREACPGARMCGRCGHGPVQHYACDDLTRHHLEARGPAAAISNACPACGWFARGISEWPMWDGTIREQPFGGGTNVPDHEAALPRLARGADSFSDDQPVRAGMVVMAAQARRDEASRSQQPHHHHPLEDDDARLAQIRADRALAVRVQRELGMVRVPSGPFYS